MNAMMVHRIKMILILLCMLYAKSKKSKGPKSQLNSPILPNPAPLSAVNTPITTPTIPLSGPLNSAIVQSTAIPSPIANPIPIANPTEIAPIPQNATDCQSASNIYISCVNSYLKSVNKSKFEDDACIKCQFEYSQMTQYCTDADYQQDVTLFYSYMNCHVENSKYCGNVMNQFQCDECGKFLSIKLIDYGYLDKLHDSVDGQDIHKEQYQTCSGKAIVNEKSASSNLNVFLSILLINQI
eukprot:NODE_960_length_2883_cov_0.478807.p2 type:complete len:240 gc:universal NODE_960_length_2883_cov_0.478807:1282-2001(+)